MGLRNLFDGPHFLILVVLVIVIFGWKKLPDAARSLGRSARILKSELGDDDSGKSSASGQTVPGQTTQQPGSVPGEAPVNGAQGYPQQQNYSGQQQGYPQQGQQSQQNYSGQGQQYTQNPQGAYQPYPQQPQNGNGNQSSGGSTAAGSGQAQGYPQSGNSN